MDTLQQDIKRHVEEALADKHKRPKIVAAVVAGLFIAWIVWHQVVGHAAGA